MDAEFDWLTLDADEEVVWSATPHSYSLVPAFLVGVPLAVVLVGIVIIVGAYLSHTNTNYVVTSDALYKKTGVLSRNVQRIEFDKVQDTSYRQSFLGARFGYGTVDVSTAGGGGVEMRFSNVAEPLQVQTLINERLREHSTGPDVEGRDADEVLAEILVELRKIRSAVEDGPIEGSDQRSSRGGQESAESGDFTGRLSGEETGRGGSTEGPSNTSAENSDADEFRFEDGS